MTEPLSLDVILGEFSENAEAWVLQDEQSKEYLIIPHEKHPGRHPIHFFLKKEDAQDVLLEILEVNEKLKDKDIFPVKVNLLQALRGIATDKTPGHADGFVVHSPNEVYEFIRDKN
ncbi:hypothetical protein L0244_15855 [bacterium]|nr:hypothetical protein [bacterium]